jgi:gas vesicle structural protein
MSITAPAPRASQTPGSRGSVQKMGGASGIADVLVVILDKGLVVDAWVRLSIIGIEILTVEIRAVIASVDTYLRYAEAIGLTTLAAAPRTVEPVHVPNLNGNGNVNGNWNRTPGLPNLSGPSDDDILAYLEAHPDGVRLSELQAYFGIERQNIESILSRLVQDALAVLDPQRGLWRSGKLLAPMTA